MLFIGRMISYWLPNALYNLHNMLHKDNIVTRWHNKRVMLLIVGSKDS